MSDYFDFPPNDWDDEGDENPFRDLPGWDDELSEEDPYAEIEEQVLQTLGIEDFDEIILTPDLANLENLRGNRFTSIVDAIFFLFDAGLLQFSGVVIDEDDIGVEVGESVAPITS